MRIVCIWMVKNVSGVVFISSKKWVEEVMWVCESGLEVEDLKN